MNSLPRRIETTCQRVMCQLGWNGAGSKSGITWIGCRRGSALNVAIVAGACASVLTASAAIGGQRLANWLALTFGLSSPAWQILCAVATVCSLAAAIATQLLKSHNVDERIARAQTARAKLDIIRFGVATGHLTEADAAAEYNALNCQRLSHRVCSSSYWARIGHATSHCSIWALNLMKTLACKLTERDSPTSVRLAYHDGLLTDLLVAELIRD